MWEVTVSHTFVHSGFSEKKLSKCIKFISGFAPTETNVNMLFKDKGTSPTSGKMESKYNLL